MRLWFWLALANNSTVAEIRERMSDDEFSYWKALYYMRVIGFEAEQDPTAMIERRIQLAMTGKGSKDIQSYISDRFKITDEEDEEFQEEKKDLEKELKERAAAGEFDAEKMRAEARAHAEAKLKEKESQENGD